MFGAPSVGLSSLDLTTLFNDELAVGFAREGAASLDLAEDVVARDEFAEHNVSTIKPISGSKSDEELRSVGVGTGVGHGEQASFVVLAVEVLIGELVAVDRDSTSAVMVGEVTALGHEVVDNSVENAALVGIFLAIVTSAEGSEVLSGLGHVVSEEL